MHVSVIISVVFLLLLSITNSSSETCKKTFVIPGAFQSRIFQPMISTEDFVAVINQKKPCSNATIFKPYLGLLDACPVWLQIKLMKPQFVKIMKDNPDGINVIGLSVGGITARGLIETTPEHNVYSFITISAPHNGVYELIGAGYYLPFIYKIIPKKVLTSIFYSPLAQHLTSLANGWKDPTQYERYLKDNVFLPFINNEKPHADSESYKQSIVKLKLLVLVAADKDQVVMPWQTCLFSYYDAELNMLNMTQQPFYINDTLGLKILYEAGLIKFYVEYGTDHFTIVNDHMIDNAIVPNLL